MSIFSNLKLLLLRHKGKDRLILKLKMEINQLKFETRKLKDEILELKKQYNFYFFDMNIEEKIINQLSKAKKEVNVAVAWITSDALINKLEELKNQGVLINIIITADKEKDKKAYYIKKKATLREISKNFKVVKISPRCNKYTKKEYENLMHNKYCIIDNKIIIDGSYNWIDNAKYSEEHIIFIESKKVAKLYKENFDKLINEIKYENNLIESVS
jgi:phosphatidylserine/phosphatidylglycerophosphate/cardiolipin synthase-like enzyme